MMQCVKKACLLTSLIAAICVPTFAQSLPIKPSTSTSSAKPEIPKPEYPPISKLTEGYTEVQPTGGPSSFYKLWYRKKDNQLLAGLPRDYAREEHFIALTISSGHVFAGLQANDFLVQWRQYGKRLAMISPNFRIKSEGDPESKDSVKRLFTDSVLLDVPILGMVPRGGPLIDLDDLLVRQASVFFGSRARTSRPQLAKIVEYKAFPTNVEVEVEIPSSTGSFMTLHYSFSPLKSDPTYKPREADERVGYFTTTYDDYGKYQADETRVRYVNRWHLEKRDPKLKMSPPKKPIIFYIEHTTPVRYRRWVRDGVLYWNKAFEEIGIVNAIEVVQQDSPTNAHMEKDPEDVRYNFVRWLNNNISTAIGPSRVNPRTGQILDADIILTDGWIRAFEQDFSKVMPKVMMEGLSPENLAWFSENPHWDPRVRMAPPSQKKYILRELQARAATPFSGHALANTNSEVLGDDEFDGLYNRVSQVNGSCLAADGRAFDVAIMRMAASMLAEKEGGDKDDDKKDDDKEEEQMLDGMPESFIGPLLADLVAHEVGHTLGLRHNFKASSVYPLEEMNSDGLKGKKPFAGSVMDYLPVNFNMKTGKIQGDYAMIGIGPYDFWAIEYGYTFSKDLKKILSRVAEPQLAFATDEDTYGPDPLARRYDFSKNPLDYANNQMRLVNHHREKILKSFVKDGDSWDKARQGYELTLSLQLRAVSMMANWIGGTHVHRDKKGDKDGRKPIEVVSNEMQRGALDFVIKNLLYDEAFGLTPELVAHMTSTFWSDRRGFGSNSEPSWPVHDRIMGLQSSLLSILMSPTTLRRVYDNEFRVEADKDAFTLNELMEKLDKAVWKELDELPETETTVRKPAVSSLRRNLQTEHLQLLMDLAKGSRSSSAALKPISNLASSSLKSIKTKISDTLGKEDKAKNLDPYTRAHFEDAVARIDRWFESKYLVN